MPYRFLLRIRRPENSLSIIQNRFCIKDTAGDRAPIEENIGEFSNDIKCLKVAAFCLQLTMSKPSPIAYEKRNGVQKLYQDSTKLEKNELAPYWFGLYTPTL